MTNGTKACFRCGRTALIGVLAKCNDLCRIARDGEAGCGYVPGGIGLGDDPSYIEFTYCRECGQMQGAEFQAE